ncbi:MAG: hypothetical protein IJB18_04460 [Clostridia bacterium]|nr:hypothetical protein [Clostridia bacterium]
MAKIKNMKWVLPLIVLAACLAFSVGVYAVYGEHNLDSDISSEMVLAQLLNEEGRVFLTDSWFYSTELRIVSPVPVYQLMLRLFDDWHIARTCSIAVLLSGVAASLVYLVRGFGASSTAALLCAAAIVLPVSKYNSFTLNYGGFYTVCVMLTFIQLGLVLRMGKKRPLEPILLAVLGFYGGLNGVRMLMICLAPLLIAAVITFFLEARGCEKMKQWLRLASFPILAGSLILAAATYAGYRVNTDVLSMQYDFAQYGETLLCALTPEMFTDQIICLMSYFGYRNNMLLLSMQGVASVLAVVIPVAGVAAMVLILRMKLTTRERLIAVFAPVALLMGMVINVLTLSEEHTAPLPYTVSYYMPAAILLVFALFWVFDRFACKNRILRVMPMLALVGVFLIGNAAYREEDMNTYETELQDIAYWMVEEGCYEGYATFWNANVLTEVTDGEIEVFCVEDWEYGDLNEWLQRKDHLDRKPEGRMFAIYRAQDYNPNLPGYEDPDHLYYASDYFYVVIFDSCEEFEDAWIWE